MNREDWLHQVAKELEADLNTAGGALPKKLRITCGWPSRGAFASRSRRIGECWLAGSEDGHIEVFVSPAISDGVEVAAVLAHELVHASGIKGHGVPFKRIAVALGLEGKMTATVAGEGLKARLNDIVARIGAYPHSKLDKSASPHKKDGTRLIKVVCPSPGCGYTIRVTQKWIEVGYPTCPCGEVMGLAE